MENTCSEAVKEALENYEYVMKSKLKNKLPCGNDELRKVHGTASKTSQAYFMAKTAGISTSATETYLKKLLFTVRQVIVIYYNIRLGYFWSLGQTGKKEDGSTGCKQSFSTNRNLQG